MPLHWHDEFQISYVTEGPVKYTVDQTSIIVEEGDGIFINSGRLHSARPYHGNHGSILVTDIHPDFLDIKNSQIRQVYVEPFIDPSQLSYYVLQKDVPCLFTYHSPPSAHSWRTVINKTLNKIHNNFFPVISGVHLLLEI